MFATSPYYGDERTWYSQTSVHNPMFDQKGRVWLTARIRPPMTADFCRKGSDHPSAKLYPMERAPRQLELYEPKSGELTTIDTCFTTHHLSFAEDADNTLWLSGGGPTTPVVGWFNTRIYEETGDERKAQGWTPLILDTNGNGKRDEGYLGPNDPVDPAKDKQIIAGFYSIAWNPVDGSIWGSVERFPGGVARLAPGDNPPATALAEYYEVPFNDPRAPVNGYGPRGMDIDRNGVVWVPLASGHLASFDRRKCTGPLNGPNATGRHCPEGWTLYPFPGPQFRGVTEFGQRRGELQYLGRPAQYFRAWLKRADLDRQRIGFAARVCRRQVRRTSRALSDGFLFQGPRWPHRRSERRLERPRVMVDLRRTDAAAYRRRRGHLSEGGQIPAPARSAGAVRRHFLNRGRAHEAA